MALVFLVPTSQSLLVSYCRPADVATERSTTPFLADILQVLSNGPMQSQDAEVRIAAVGAVACWARATEQAFAPFYSPIVPLLLPSAHSPDDQLNEAYPEAATIIGQAVPDLFAADAHRIMDSVILYRPCKTRRTCYPRALVALVSPPFWENRTCRS